jgi:hypothetical protein
VVVRMIIRKSENPYKDVKYKQFSKKSFKKEFRRK